MAKRMLIDATHSEETRVVVVNGNKLDELDFEIASKKQLKGNIYLAKVTRVEPSLQAAFVNMAATVTVSWPSRKFTRITIVFPSPPRGPSRPGTRQGRARGERRRGNRDG